MGVGGPYSFGVDLVLHRHRNPVERAAIPAPGDLPLRIQRCLPGFCGQHGYVSVKVGVDLLNATQVRIHRFHGRYFFSL